MLLYYITALRFHHQVQHIYSKNNYMLDLKDVKNETHFPINPSIIYTNNDFWGTVRVTNDHKCVKELHKEYTNEVHYIENYRSHGVLDPGDLDWCKHVTFRRKGCEDPRSFVWNGEKYALVTVVGKSPNPCNNKIFLYNIRTKVWTRIFSPFSDNKQMEKNWTPLIYQDELYIEYFVNPRKIFHYKTGNKVDVTLCPKMSIYLHGSVNSVRINDFFFLGMAHSNPGYFHVFYLFEAKYPFRIFKFGKYFGIDRYNETQYEFVTGMSYIERTDEIIISYSINDCVNKLKVFPLQQIKNSMIYSC